MLFGTLDSQERLPRQEGRRAASRGDVNWVEEVDCVTLICENRRLVVLAFWNQLRIAHRSPLTADQSLPRKGSVVPSLLDLRQLQFSLNRGFWLILTRFIAEDNLVSSLDFGRGWLKECCTFKVAELGKSAS